jgi:hypothetical protein
MPSPELQPTHTDSEHYTLLQADMLKLWEQLPPYQQAEMVVMLVESKLKESGIRLTWQVESVDEERSFVVTSLNREDLARTDLTEAQIALLSDDDLAHIASKLEDNYVELMFWEDLEAAACTVLQVKYGQDTTNEQ